ncbi:MAG: alpha/beta hydrolase, partial [Bdellovibrionaceae bacterium]|nr:alpha/beta hydrolase [Pseudobdellovibrionaceae bacterium]
SAENILWVQAAANAERRVQGVDDVIQINLDDYGIKDLDKKREIIAKGAELSYNQIKKISKKYGL